MSNSNQNTKQVSPADRKKQGKKKSRKPRRFLVVPVLKTGVRPLVLQGLLAELDNVIMSKGGVIVPQSHPNYQCCRQQALAKLSDSDKNVYDRYRNTIIHSMFGTEMPEVPVSLITSGVTPSSGVLTSTYTIQLNNVGDNSVFTSLFDEYIFRKARIVWIPQKTPGFSAANTIALGCGVCDYTDSTVLASTAQAIAYDTNKVFYLEHPGKNYREEWKFKFIYAPDIEWTHTTQNVAIAYWKTYAFAGVAGSSSYGNVFGYALVQFRQKIA